MKLSHYIFIAFTSCILFFSLASFIPADSSLDNDIFTYTNKFRKSKGKAALEMRGELNSIAEKHSKDMAAKRVAFGHDGFDDRDAAARKKFKDASRFAENVAYGAKDGEDVVEMWKGSSGHRKNMLGDYKYIGIGTARDSKGVIYYTQIFVN